jgi:protein-S-isoprenylcysteine O-methyltransferase Ste14
VPLVLGILLLILANMMFSRHKTPPEPWKPAAELVQDGPYRFTRNPIYLSFALIYLGISLIFNLEFALVLLTPGLVVIDRNQISREELYLKEKFGEEYDRYKARVRRWI